MKAKEIGFDKLIGWMLALGDQFADEPVEAMSRCAGTRPEIRIDDRSCRYICSEQRVVGVAPWFMRIVSQVSTLDLMTKHAGNG